MWKLTRTVTGGSARHAAFAKAHGYRLIDEFYDAEVSGADPVTERPGFKAMLDRIAGNGVRITAVPDASRRELHRQRRAPGEGRRACLGGRRASLRQRRRAPRQVRRRVRLAFQHLRRHGHDPLQVVRAGLPPKAGLPPDLRLLPPPALGERRHRRLVRWLVAVRWRARYAAGGGGGGCGGLGGRRLRWPWRRHGATHFRFNATPQSTNSDATQGKP